MYTPVDLENLKFKLALLGFDKTEVMEFVASIYADFDRMYKENIALKDKNAMLSDAIKEYKAMEVALRDTVVSAHNISDDIKKNAHKEADLIITEANNKKEEMLTKAKTEFDEIMLKTERLKQEYNIYKSKIKGLMHAQTEILEELE